jgi:ATP-dependent Lhr-like helicase
VRQWFEGAFAAPTPAQEQAWPAIAGGEHVLISAPTGSGKTLAAFLWALDRLSCEPTTGERCTRLVYVSPLKALSYDIERNLRAPLRGIGADLRVGLRTGDTSQRERAQMLRNPPDILITTPESLYLMLTSRARTTLSAVQWVILDEIHAVAASKRGAHLALTLERLQAQCEERPLQRIGLSATQNPLAEVARFMVGPARHCRIVDTGIRKPLDLQIHVPVESMTELDRPAGGADGLDPLAGGEALRGSIWPAIYPELLRLIREHRSTILFVNNRRSAERLALRLNELAAEQEQGGEGDGSRPASPAENAEDRQREAGVSGEIVRAHHGVSGEIARAHHGSLAREERTQVEEALKAGAIPCIVATSSLELGIDMGAVDLVLQVESPKSVATGLQRIGRAGHNVGDVSRGRIFPKFRADLLECAVLARRMREGKIETTVVPRLALDVLAQQIVAMAAAEEELEVDELYARVTRTYSYSELTRRQLENLLDMLDGRYPSSEFAQLRPRIVWDRLAGVIRPRRGARALAVANAGTIPDRGLYLVTLPDGRRVGELDEEMVYEARPGQVFLLGASSWRIEEIGRDRVIVTPAPGVPGAIPFWKGDGLGRPRELGEAIGAFARWAVDQPAATLAREYDLDERAAENLLQFLREQREATGVLPSDRTIVLERFRDEIGDWRLCVLSPFGARVHAAWALALSARVRAQLGLEADALWSDDGIVLRLPEVEEEWERGDGLAADAPAAAPEWVTRAGVAPAEGRADLPPGVGRADLPPGVGRTDSPPGEESADPPPGAWSAEVPPSLLELLSIEPDELEDLVVGELAGTALFGARFRESAARALLIPRAYPGKRTPLWQQRLKAQTLLEVARRYPDFPIVLEAYRECLRDVLDLQGLRELLARVARRELSLVEVQTATASPFASSLLFDYIATYMYEGDTPSAERRAAALSLDRDLLRELLGQEELRELIDPGALAQVEDELQHRSERLRVAGRDELHDMLRLLGDLNVHEAQERTHTGVDAAALLATLERERRAVRVRIAGEERFIDAADAGLYRDALGAAPPGGLPQAFLADVPDALVRLLTRYARTHGPFPTAWPRQRYGLDPTPALAELERRGALVRGELRPGGAAREWCEVDVLRRLRRASLAALRKEIEPAEQLAFAAFLPAWQGAQRRQAASGAGMPAAAGKPAALDRLREALVPLQGLALTPEVWERDVLPARLGDYAPAWLDTLCASGELLWLGAGALGRTGGRVALYFREDLPLLGPPAPTASSMAPALAAAPHDERLADSEHDALRERLAAGPCFFTDLLADLTLAPEVLLTALWDLVWAGEVTNDVFAPLRAPRLTLARAQRQASAVAPRRFSARRFSARRPSGARAEVQGRWSLTAPLLQSARGGGWDSGDGGDVRMRALAELLLERYGILTRELVLAEGLPGGFAALYPQLARLETLGRARRGYFVEGLGGVQFALPGAVERLRSLHSAVCSRAATEAPPLVLAATDPAQPYGAALPWPERAGRRLARAAGAHVVLLGGAPLLYIERGARALQVLVKSDDPRLPAALGALAEHARAGRGRRVAIERVDGAPVLGSPWEPLLAQAGFYAAGGRALTLSRSA